MCGSGSMLVAVYCSMLPGPILLPYTALWLPYTALYAARPRTSGGSAVFYASHPPTHLYLHQLSTAAICYHAVLYVILLYA